MFALSYCLHTWAVSKQQSADPNYSSTVCLELP